VTFSGQPSQIQSRLWLCQLKSALKPFLPGDIEFLAAKEAPFPPDSLQKQITPHVGAGLFGKLLGLAEGAEALYESQLRSGLKDSRLKPQPPHVYHYNQNSSYIWIALLSRVTAEYRHITKKSTA
jgi:hypothetical protein